MKNSRDAYVKRLNGIYENNLQKVIISIVNYNIDENIIVTVFFLVREFAAK